MQGSNCSETQSVVCACAASLHL